MSVRKPLVGFGAFALVAVVLTWVMWTTLQRGVEGDTRTYTATFTDVLGLKVGDDVRIAGVRVGRVDDIALDQDYNAVVRFQVHADQTVTTSTQALVRYQNLIGQRYIELVRGDDPDAATLASGESIPLERTEPSFDVSALLGGLQPLFDVLQPDQINSLSQTFIQALQGDQISLSGFLAQAAALAATFDDRDAILGDVITNLSGVIDGLADRSGEFETLLAQTRTLVAGLYTQGQQLQDSTVRVSNSTSALVDMVDQVRPAIDRAQDSTTQALAPLLGAGAKLDQLALDAPPALTDLARVTSEGTYLTLMPCLIDVSLGGILFPRGLFTQIGGTAHSPVCR